MRSGVPADGAPPAGDLSRACNNGGQTMHREWTCALHGSILIGPTVSVNEVSSCLAMFGIARVGGVGGVGGGGGFVNQP